MLRVVEYFAKSLNVTENGRPTLRKLGYGLPFTFRSKYDDNLYRFRDKVRYWSRFFFHTALALDAPVRASPRNIGTAESALCIASRGKN